LSNYESFKNIKNWMDEVKNNCPLNSIVYVIGNKSDLKRNVNENDVNNLIRNEKINYYEISAIHDDEFRMIEKIFKKLGKEIIEKFQNDFYSLSERESMNNNNFPKKISMSHNSLKISNTEENESKIKNYCC
jgi:Ras-related protein Rab-8A